MYSSFLLNGVPDVSKAIAQMLRVLKVDGHIILYLPHPEFYPKPSRETFEEYGHVRIVSEAELDGIFAKSNLTEKQYCTAYSKNERILRMDELNNVDECAIEYVVKKVK